MAFIYQETEVTNNISYIQCNGCPCFLSTSSSMSAEVVDYVKFT